MKNGKALGLSEKAARRQYRNGNKDEIECVCGKKFSCKTSTAYDLLITADHKTGLDKKEAGDLGEDKVSSSFLLAAAQVWGVLHAPSVRALRELFRYRKTIKKAIEIKKSPFSERNICIGKVLMSKFIRKKLSRDLKGEYVCLAMDDSTLKSRSISCIVAVCPKFPDGSVNDSSI